MKLNITLMPHLSLTNILKSHNLKSCIYVPNFWVITIIFPDLLSSSIIKPHKKNSYKGHVISKDPNNQSSRWLTSSGFFAASKEFVRPRRTSKLISLATCHVIAKYSNTIQLKLQRISTKKLLIFFL